jgi:cytochrome b561
MAKIKTRRKMGWILIAFHWTMILMTVGLWTPIYLAARRRRVTITHVPDGYAGPVPPMR